MIVVQKSFYSMHVCTLNYALKRGYAYLLTLIRQAICQNKSKHLCKATWDKNKQTICYIWPFFPQRFESRA